MNIYNGYNIHNYTKQIIDIIPKYFGNIVYGKINNKKWNNILIEIKKTIPNYQTIQNINKNFKNGYIIDPELPKINIAIILVLIWEQIKNDTILCKHFSETLQQIGNTCIQGISHRLIIDYIAMYNDTIYQYLSIHFNKKIVNIIVDYM